MASPANKMIINLLLVGKTGVGKSSSGNSILGHREFRSAASQGIVTQKCQVKYASVQGRRVKVVDVPGLADASLSEADDVQKVINEVTAAIDDTPEGFDAILTVIPFGRISKEEKTTSQKLKDIFGKNYVAEHGILLVTGGDRFQEEYNDHTFEDWCSNKEGFLHELQRECDGRVILFDNRSKDSEIQKCQLQRLFAMVDTMKSGSKYLPKCFVAAQKGRDKLILETKEPLILKETQAETTSIMNILKGITLEHPERDIPELMNLQNTAEKLLQQVRELDKGTGALKNVIELVKSVQRAISEKMGVARSILDKKEMEEKLAKTKADGENERNRLMKEREKKEKSIQDLKESHERERVALDNKLKEASQRRACTVL